MKSTSVTLLVLGACAAVIGGVVKSMELAGGNYLLMGGLFMALLGGAFLAIDNARHPLDGQN